MGYRAKKRRAKLFKEIKKNVLLAVKILVPIVMLCLVIGIASGTVTGETVAEVFNGFGKGNAGNFFESIGDGIANLANGIAGLGSKKEETAEVNYIYERIREDSNEVVILGDLEADEDTVKQLTKTLNNYSGEISVKAVTVDGSKGLSYNSTGEYFSASTVKAGYILYGYKQMEQGNGSPDEKKEYTSNFYHGGTGTMQYDPVGTVYTLKEIMRRTMWESDNVGYSMCIDRWGKEGYNEMLKEMGCESFLLKDWSEWVYAGRAEDLMIIWKEIYDYMNEDNQYAKLMYDSCTFYDGCGKYNFLGNALPGYTVSQKYGWSDDAYGDAAIIYGKNCDYLLVVLTDSSGSGYDQQVFNNVVRLINKLMDK